MALCCQEMKHHLKEGEVAVVYLEKLREYGIRILDGGDSIQVIRYCPWCGACLPRSLRDEWFRQLELLGKDLCDEIPLPMQSDECWRSAGL